MKLNFKVSNVKVIEGLGGITIGNGGLGIRAYSLPKLEIETSVTGKGIKNSTANIDLSELSEELHEELLAVFNKIEKNLNKKGK